MTFALLVRYKSTTSCHLNQNLLLGYSFIAVLIFTQYPSRILRPTFGYCDYSFRLQAGEVIKN